MIQQPEIFYHMLVESKMITDDLRVEDIHLKWVVTEVVEIFFGNIKYFSYLYNMNLLIGFLYGLVAQIITFLQLQGSIKYGWYEKYPIIIILASIPSGWLFLKSVQHFVMAFDGEIWPSRLLGYGIGVIVFTLMSWQLFGEHLNTKTLVCLGLSVAIILIQILWK